MAGRTLIDRETKGPGASDVTKSALDDAVVSEEARKFLGVSHGTMKLWRLMGVGPEFVKSGGSYIYSRDNLRDWREIINRARCGERDNG